jgi:DNA-binding response OmpR family regulator
MNILIAEDDIVSRKFLVKHLNALHHSLMIAKDGQEAWETYSAHHFNVVITDWMMPKINGLELARMIRTNHRERYTYIIFLTVLHGKENFMEAMKAGADDFISKPFDLDQLFARLNVAERIIGMQKELHSLQELLPICSYCKKIRDEKEEWIPVDSYISKRTASTFSHGICPECYTEHIAPSLSLMKDRRNP